MFLVSKRFLILPPNSAGTSPNLPKPVYLNLPPPNVRSRGPFTPTTEPLETTPRTSPHPAVTALVPRNQDRRHRTMGQINQKPRCKYWATRSSVCLLARTAHSFVYSTLLALLAHSAALTRSLARSLCSLPCSCESDWLFILVFFSILAHSAPAGK